MLSQLKKDLARMQNEYSIDDAIIYNVGYGQYCGEYCKWTHII